MRRRWLLVLGAAVAVSLGVWLVRGSASHTKGRVTPLASIGAEVLELDAGEIVRRGSTEVVVVRFRGAVELVPHHFRADGRDGPMTADEWAQALDAPLVFNAGQFDEELNHLGWLKSRGQWLSSHRKAQWLALLLSAPVEAAPHTAVMSRIADLEHAAPDIAERYQHVVQSMMLVDEAANVRVRDTELAASRTVVAEDKAGRILILHCAGAVTLGDLARWLPTQGLGIVRAMNLDGGIEAQLAIRTPELQRSLYGQHGTGSTVFESGAGVIRYPLPAVIAVRPHLPVATARP